MFICVFLQVCQCPTWLFFCSMEWELCSNTSAVFLCQKYFNDYTSFKEICITVRWLTFLDPRRTFCCTCSMYFSFWFKSVCPILVLFLVTITHSGIFTIALEKCPFIINSFCFTTNHNNCNLVLTLQRQMNVLSLEQMACLLSNWIE